MVVSQLTWCKTRLLSVLNSNDLITRTVKVASVRGRVRFVGVSEIPSEDICNLVKDFSTKVVNGEGKEVVKIGRGKRRWDG